MGPVVEAATAINAFAAKDLTAHSTAIALVARKFSGRVLAHELRRTGLLHGDLRIGEVDVV